MTERASRLITDRQRDKMQVVLAAFLALTFFAGLRQHRPSERCRLNARSIVNLSLG